RRTGRSKIAAIKPTHSCGWAFNGITHCLGTQPMKSFSATHKLLLGGAAVVAFGVAAVLSVGSPNAQPGGAQPKAGPTDPTMFGGTVARNMVNTVDKGIPDKVDPDGADVLWKAALGSRAYGGPIVSGGKVFVGTNNEGKQHRNARDTFKNPMGEIEGIDRGIL